VRDLPPHSFERDRRRQRGAGGGRGAPLGTDQGGASYQTSPCSSAKAGHQTSGASQAQGEGNYRESTSFEEPSTKENQVTDAAVAVERLEKTLGANTVLRGISLEAKAGEIFGLLGPNGAGKTTTLRIICTLLSPDVGSVEVLGFSTRTAPEEVRKRIGVVTADIGLYPRLSARENIEYFGRLCGLSGADLDRKVNGVLERLDMGSFAKQRAESLSSGQKQKVAIARAIVHDPQVLMFDEPTSNLDVLASKEVREFMVEVKGRGKCVIFSTHVMHDAERLCDRITIIHQGRVVASGGTAEVRGEHRDLEDAFLALVEAR
jgi:sodium transport system ATP-binding protein